MDKVLGIIGGMGPEAAVKFLQNLQRHISAGTDQDYPKIILYNNSKIPDRTQFILGNGPNPLDEILKTGRTLQNAGADVICMPCITAHIFIDILRNSLTVPIIDILEETNRQIQFNKRSIGILSTTGAINARLFHKYFNNNLIIPDLTLQEKYVMKAIYNIKGGEYIESKKLLLRVGKELILSGADAILLGCTEIPLVLKEGDLGILTIDPLDVVARDVLRYLA